MLVFERFLDWILSSSCITNYKNVSLKKLSWMLLLISKFWNFAHNFKGNTVILILILQFHIKYMLYCYVQNTITISFTWLFKMNNIVFIADLKLYVYHETAWKAFYVFTRSISKSKFQNHNIYVWKKQPEFFIDSFIAL